MQAIDWETIYNGANDLHDLTSDCIQYLLTRNTCMQQPLAYIFQTLFQHEVFVITL